MAQMIFNPGQFTTPKAKPLPIILLLDTSGSMDIVTNPDEVRRTGNYGVVDGNNVEFVEGGITRISVLNDAVRKMIRTFAKYERDATEFLVSIITFGDDTRMILPPTAASDVRFVDLVAAGDITPLGKALTIAKTLVEDRTQIPSRAYCPLVILVSDGEANDNWQPPFYDFIRNGRSAKCDRIALAIGNEANRNMLAQFIEGTDHSVFEADTADQITDFFKFVTMSSVQRTLSQNPNEIPKDTDVRIPPQPGASPAPANPETPVKSPGADAAPVQPGPEPEEEEEEGYW